MLLTAKRCNLWASTLTRLTSSHTNVLEHFSYIAQLTHLDHSQPFPDKYTDRQTSSCWEALPTITMLRSLRLHNFPLAKASYLANVLQLEHLEVANPPGGQVFEVSLQVV